jgi:hypothetical protein
MLETIALVVFLVTLGMLIAAVTFVAILMMSEEK